MDTRLLRTPLYYGQFSLSLGKVHTLSLSSTHLIQTPVNKGQQTLVSCPMDRFSNILIDIAKLPLLQEKLFINVFKNKLVH